MSNKRAFWSLLSVVLIGAFALSACAAPATPTPAEAPAQPTQAPATQAPTVAPVTLHYSLWDPNQQLVYQKCADAFTAKNPNIKIEISQLGWADYWTNLQTGFTAGTAPDVFTDHLAYYPSFAAKGQVMDIQPLVDRDKVDLSIYLPGLADLWVRNGKRYGLPKDWDTVAIVFNKNMLDKAGVTVDEVNNMTWNPTDGGTFQQIIAKLTLDKNGHNGLDPAFDKNNVVQYGFTFFSDTGNGTAYGQQQWSYLVEGNGAKYVDQLYGTQYYYDDPKFAEAIDWVARMMNDTLYAAPYTDIKSLGGFSLFQSGKVAMISDGSWMISSYAQDTFPTGFALLPTGPAGRKSMFNGLTDGIWTGTKHPEEAWKWVKFLASPECADIVGNAGVVFPAQEHAVQLALAADKAKGLDVSAFTTEATTSGDTFLYPLTDHAPEINDIMNQTMDAIFLGTKDAKTALADANKQVNALFK
jgi:multiple sugar transport system substrate-binding protein